MMTLYKGKYRIESTRLKNYDYAANGWYFVTICTGNHLCYFGDIVQGKMQLSALGQIAQQFWVEIPEHFNNTFIDAYVIMPNHVHGIVVIDHPVETRHGASLQSSQNHNDQSNQFSPLKKGSLSIIINAYKSSVTRWCRKNGYDYFAWQPRFYDHIIRDNDSLERIRDYIHNNPVKWEEDKDNISNLWM
ncbi:transposase [Aphanothece hegewaldii CCALA 016]|uniref:Transposase n=1 Tax=Aphanothece hegewaldii CCALA 016 TaxID=2107694 RepID=A0A2T1LRK3_9CHRO|nr:transposase [Aphanothece hegewaldii CCALA 016]